MTREAEILFHELADLSSAQREAYLQEHQAPADVRAEVEALLRFDRGEDHVLTESVAGCAEAVLDRTAELNKPSRCGPYRLLRLLGRGGMGTVYLAERADGEVEQRVAIKLLRHDEDEGCFRDRFLRERQILAELSHPGIGRLLDAGHTEKGQPYLVMEYIEGAPIDAYAERLELRGKLGLFVRVCEAVSYLHRNLVVHRDIKPSNILVDTSGEPKLLDFGIAKMLDSAADQTRTQERLLTPEYASPEQVRGAAQATTSDIYSLGCVLYKLLTGHSPHALDRENRESIESAICSTEPPAPSRLNPALPRDLDFIVLKALRKEPEERYSSADALAYDLHALLESRPVRARSGSAWYRTRKFLRRYWAPVAAAALVIASLSAGLYVANRERAIAQQRFLQVRQLANKVLALDSVIRVLPGSTKARKEVVAISQQYLEALAAEARTDLDLTLEVAEAYFLLAHAQGVPPTANLGQYVQAAESLRKADALLESALHASPRNRKALLLSAEVARDRMILADESHQREEELAQAGKAVASLNHLLALGKTSDSETETAAGVFANIALGHKNIHLYGDSILYARRSVELFRRLPSKEAEVGNGLSIIADSLRVSGDLDGALHAIQEARENVEKAVFPGETLRRSKTFNVLWREGVILGQDGSISLDRPDEALTVFQKAFDITEEWAERDPDDASCRILLASAAREMGKILLHGNPRRALAIYDLALRRIREVVNNVSARHEEEFLLAGSSYVLRRLNRGAEAKDRIDAAFRLLRETKDYPAGRASLGDEADAAIRALGDHLAETGEPRRATQIYQELLDKTMAYFPDSENDLRRAIKLSSTYEALAALDRRAGHSDDADALDARRLDLWKHWDSKLPNHPFVLRQINAIGAK